MLTSNRPLIDFSGREHARHHGADGSVQAMCSDDVAREHDAHETRDPITAGSIPRRLLKVTE